MEIDTVTKKKKAYYMLKLSLVLLLSVATKSACCDRATELRDEAKKIADKAAARYDSCYRTNGSDDVCADEKSALEKAEADHARTTAAVGKECYGIDPL